MLVVYIISMLCVQVTVSKAASHALVAFEEVAAAQQAVMELRGLSIRGRKLQVDFASRECQVHTYCSQTSLQTIP